MFMSVFNLTMQITDSPSAPVKINELFIRPSNNVAWRLMTGKETKQESKEMDKVMDAMIKFQVIEIMVY